MKMFKSFKYANTNNIITISVMVFLYILFTIWLSRSYVDSFIIFMSIQVGVVLLAMSPVGSWILRVLFRARKMKGNLNIHELFDEVYDSVKEKYPDCPKNIKLYYDRDMSINAYAVGSDTIVITRGSIESLNDDQLRGVLAHEFGHLVHKDTSIPLVMLVGNILFLPFFVLFKIFQLMAIIIDAIMRSESSHFTARIINGLINMGLALFLLVLTAILSINKRSNEYKADYFAYSVDYGEELLSALKLLDRLDMSGNRSLLESIKASHPYTDYRIGELESLLA